MSAAYAQHRNNIVTAAWSVHRQKTMHTSSNWLTTFHWMPDKWRKSGEGKVGNYHVWADMNSVVYASDFGNKILHNRRQPRWWVPTSKEVTHQETLTLHYHRVQVDRFVVTVAPLPCYGSGPPMSGSATDRVKCIWKLLWTMTGLLSQHPLIQYKTIILTNN